MNEDPIDDRLAEGLGPRAAEALSAWARLKRLTFRLVRWLTNGKSGATVGIVREDGRFVGPRILIIKIDSIGQRDLAEYTLQLDAIDDARAFANEHLAEPVHDPIAVGDGTYIVFQQVAGGSLSEFGVLTTLLNAARDPAADESTGKIFVDACTSIVRSTLTEWNEKPGVEEMSVPAFLQRHLAERLSRPGRLRDMAETMVDDFIPVAGRSLPNPFALVREESPSAHPRVDALVGRAHGDLHTENIMLPISGGPSPDAYRLIDLARYAPDAPLVRDPVHLLLYTVARELPDLTERSREALINLLVDPRAQRGAQQLPSRLRDLTIALHGVADDWLRPRSLVDDWNDQWPLSLTACALIYLGRGSTREEDRPWFLQLAARAAEQYLVAHALGVQNVAARLREYDLSSAVRADGDEPPARLWISRLCEYLPELRRRAASQGLAAELETLITAAKLGQDASTEFVELVRRLGGPADVLRIGLPGIRGGKPLMDEVYECKSRLCPRAEPRMPSGGVPQCNLYSRDMTLRDW